VLVSPQRSIDDKFRCLEEREGQVSRLQLALREKERDLDRLRCILSNNEETITVGAVPIDYTRPIDYTLPIGCIHSTYRLYSTYRVHSQYI